MGLQVELLQLVDRQVNAIAHGVFAHVADDVGQLKRQPQLVRVGGGGRVGLAENARRHFADNARHQVAIALQRGKVEVAVLRQIHLAAFDDGQQVARLDAVEGGVGHQRFHHRMRRVAREGLGDFALPPAQLGLGHAGIGDFINDIVDFTAEGVKGGDGGAPFLGQEQEGVIKTAAGCGGFLLDIVLGRHAGDCRRVLATARLARRATAGAITLCAGPTKAM